MTNLFAARIQMGLSLGFHIIFAVIGIAMPLMMVIAESLWIRTRRAEYLELAKRWARGTAILFAVGAVSGTVLSFELGLLWPHFMEFSGPIIGLLFSLEGFAFFTEAIFLGIYLYGWDRIRPKLHVTAGLIVAASGAASAVFVVVANGWMNTPTGFRMVNEMPVDIDPISAMRNPMGLMETQHMLIAAYAATGFLVAGIHGFLLLRHPQNTFHQRAFRIAFAVGAICAMLQPLSGDILSRGVAEHQPRKLAAFEALFHTEQGAPFRIGGIPDMETGTISYAIEIPYLLSFLLYQDPNATVIGLEEFPRDEWPPVGIVHTAFQLMIAAGFIMAGLALWGFYLWWRNSMRVLSQPFLWSVVFAAPLGLLAVEAGWVVTEVGRQPWIISGFLRTSEAVTPMPGLVIPFILFAILYLFLAGIVIWLLLRHVSASVDAPTHSSTLP